VVGRGGAEGFVAEGLGKALAEGLREALAAERLGDGLTDADADPDTGALAAGRGGVPLWRPGPTS
jgi:hypothetical protein